MNIWDILILLAVAGLVALAVRAIRSGKSGGCHSAGGCCGDCASCAMEQGCDKKKEKKSFWASDAGSFPLKYVGKRSFGRKTSE